MSGSGISWAICKSAPRSRQITTPAPHNSVFYRPDALPATQPTASKHWRDSRPYKPNSTNLLPFFLELVEKEDRENMADTGALVKWPLNGSSNTSYSSANCLSLTYMCSFLQTQRTYKQLNISRHLPMIITIILQFIWHHKAESKLFMPTLQCQYPHRCRRWHNNLCAKLLWTIHC